MPPTYDDAGVTYNDPSVLYDGEAAPAILVEIGGARYEGYLVARSLQVRTPSDGSQATCDFTLSYRLPPASIPVVDDAVKVTGGTPVAGLRLYEGYIRSVRVEEIMRADDDSTYTYVHVSCQDDGEQVWLPVAAPFAISDQPDYATSFPYRALTLTSDRVDADTVRTRGTIVIQRAGLEPGMNVTVTSGNNPVLAALELAVQQVAISWPAWDKPEWSLEVGAPLIRLAQVVRDIPDGAITETMISDGAISTPKLSALAVIANVINAGGTVVIDENGILITGGVLEVKNSGGEVIIDGEHDMFRIAATGLLSVTVASGGFATEAQVHTELTVSGTPACIMMVGPVAALSTETRFLGQYWGLNPSSVRYLRAEGSIYVDGSNHPVVALDGYNEEVTSLTYDMRYYILEQTAI